MRKCILPSLLAVVFFVSGCAISGGGRYVQTPSNAIRVVIKSGGVIARFPTPENKFTLVNNIEGTFMRCQVIVVKTRSYIRYGDECRINIVYVSNKRSTRVDLLAKFYERKRCVGNRNCGFEYIGLTRKRVDLNPNSANYDVIPINKIGERDRRREHRIRQEHKERVLKARVRRRNRLKRERKELRLRLNQERLERRLRLKRERKER